MLDTSLTPLPIWGCLPICLHPHSLVGFPVHLYVLEIFACDMGEYFPYVGALADIPICWGFGGHQHMGCSFASSCTFL